MMTQKALLINNSSSKTLLNTSTNRSGLARVSKPSSDTASQTDAVLLDQPKLCTDDIKSMRAQVSTKCEVSVETARVAVKTVAKALYNHDFYLAPDEQQEKPL